MAALHGYLGAIYMVSDVTYSDISTEAVGTGDGTTKRFGLDNTNVDFDNLTVTIGGTAQRLYIDFDISPKGDLDFTSAPASDAAIVASYRYYPVILPAGGFFSWNLDLTCDTHDVTDFGSAGWRNHIAGLRGWSGSAERHWKDSDFSVNVSGRRVVLRFYLDETNSDYYTAWGLVSGVSTGANVGEVIDETINFQGTYLVGLSDVG